MKISKVLYWLLLVALVATFLISGSFVARYIIDAVQQKNEYDQLAEIVERSRQDAMVQTEPATVPTSPDPGQPAMPTEPTEPTILPEYATLYEENPDLVGWMRIDGTPVNYPVMQTPDRTDYYLKRNFSGAYSEHGCLYVR